MLLVALVAGSAGAAYAAVPVEESIGITRDGTERPAARQPAPPASSEGVSQGTPWSSGEVAAQDTGGLHVRGTTGVAAQPATGELTRHSELFYQMQVLQQEMQELRGQVEELTHQLDRLARDQREQYMDLDRRILALRGAPGADAAADAPLAAPAGAGASAGEREAYAAAFDLMRQRRFPESTAAFSRLLAEYPNGEMAANAHYWLGELYLAQNEFERARQSFTQVVNLYPDNQKVPDSLYKLGVVHHRIGDTGRAREFLNRVISQHPRSSAAGLAQTYLAELQ
jgi:tol-pal system protein YbgF